MVHDQNQKTIAKEGSCSGIGVHSGQVVNLTVKPAPINHGIQFIRTDLPHRPRIPARFNKVIDTSLATVIGSDGFIISTIEHLMAAFTGLSIDNALVEINSYEMPIMDGSAGPFTRMIKSAGIKNQSAPRCFLVVSAPLELAENDKFVGIYPAPHFKVSCSIEFDHPVINTQQYSVIITEDHFEKQIANARTFGFLYEQEYMKKFGLGQGASLENVVVIDENGVLNEGGLRYDDEFVRHKLLDCIGDFSLLGLPILGHIVAKRSGHAFHHLFVEKIFNRKDAWQTRTFDHHAACEQASGKQLANY
jgi:UDP-3-O-[3-hydroxymyristoyl] N-acetylglucosamine deacetylase